VVVAGSVEVGEKIYNVLVSADPELLPLLEVLETLETVAFPETELETLDPVIDEEPDDAEPDDTEPDNDEPDVDEPDADLLDV